MCAGCGAGFDQSGGMFQLTANRGARAAQGRLPHPLEKLGHSRLVGAAIQFEIRVREVHG